MDSLRQSFMDPAAIYRSAPFWSWNDRLEIPELERQIDEMAKQGMGGFFMHSRSGLLTPYMGEEWMQCIDACVEKARRLAVKAWLYDEDRWPSGFAGGKVPGERKELSALNLMMKEVASAADLPPAEEVVAVFRAGGKSHDEWRMIDYSQARSEKGPFKVFVRQWHKPIPWLNDGTYPSLINPEAVDAFIESTYEPYRNRAGKDFGGVVPGIFTDEPTYSSNPWGVEAKIPWLENLDEIFEKENGYSILPHLPKLFLNLPGHEKMRLDYWRTVSQLFARNFTRRIGDWCGRHGLMLTGHFLCEDYLASQVCYAGNVMAHYEWMQLPGVDHLGGNLNYLMTMKQVGSVANQLGKPRVLCEIYGGSGWDFSFEGQKWMGDWEYSLGVNLRCQHLSLYTLRGCRKRDFPPSIFFQQSWWEHYRMVEDYFGRLSLILSSGKYLPEILVIHPINSAFANYLPSDSHALDELDGSFKSLSTWLCELHRTYDYGEEGIMQRHGRVENGRLIVGEMTYAAVIIPPSVTLQQSTIEMLNALADEGGKVIALENSPTMIDCEESGELREFIRNKCGIVPLDKGAVKKALDETMEQVVSVSDSSGEEISDIYMHRRQHGKSMILFLNNISREKSYDAVVRVKATGFVEEWGLISGNIEEMACESKDGWTAMRLHFEPVGSHLVTIDASRKQGRKKAEEAVSNEEKAAVLDGEWAFKRLDPNVLTLDFCRYRIGSGEWSPRMVVWKAQKEIREHFGLRVYLHNEGVSLWKMEELGIDRTEKPEQVSLEFMYTTEKPRLKTMLVVETPEIFEVILNGKKLEWRIEDTRMYIERCFRTIEVTGFQSKGGNTIVLSCEYNGTQELENIYVAGDFGVYERNGSYVLDEEPGKLATGDWVSQGYPFYSGRMIYMKTFSISRKTGQYVLSFEGLRSIVTSVCINGKNAGRLAWKPYSLDMTNVIKDGENELGIEVYTSLRNTLGPHHTPEDIVTNIIGPLTYIDEKNWRDSYILVPYGIMGEVSLVRRY